MTGRPTKKRRAPALRAGERITASKESASIRLSGRSVILGLACALGLLLLSQIELQGVIEFINRPIAKVRLENHWQQISQEDVRGVLSSHLGAGYFSFEVEGLKAELEQHPWIARATIKKLWPDTLSIHLQEQVAIARWGDTHLLNQQGDIMSPPDASALGHLPVLRGPAQSQPVVMAQYQHINQLLFASGLRLSGLSLSERGSWELELDNSLRVTVGKEAVAQRLERFVRFYQGAEAERRASMASVDLRYDNGIAVKYSDATQTEVASR